MRRHDAGHPGVDRRPERHEFHTAEPFDGMLDQRELQMRIGAGITVTRKMLAARRDPGVLQRVNDGGAEPRDHVRLIRQRAIADHRVLRIGVNVQHRRVVE